MPIAETDIRSPDYDLKSVLTFRLSHLQNNLNVNASKLLRQHSDLSLAEWRIISVMYLLGETTMTQLIQEISMDKGQTSRTMKNLISKDYVRASASETDGRRQNLCLSKAGQAVYYNLLPLMRQRQHDLVAGVLPEELTAFNRVLDQLQANVQLMKGVNPQDGNDG